MRPEDLRRRLHAAGYERVNTVLEPCQNASRGGIVDLWPPAHPAPLRLEFFGDELEAIRSFDPASQRTLESLNVVLITPAREVLNTLPATDPVDGGTDEISEFDIPRLHPVSASILDYLDDPALVLIDDYSSLDGMMEEIEQQAVQLRQAAIEDERLPQGYPLPYVTWSELRDQLASFGALELGQPAAFPEESSRSQAGLGEALFRHDERFGGRLKPFTDYLLELAQKGEQITVVSRQSCRLQELWREAADTQSHDEAMQERSTPQFIEASLREGFLLTGHTCSPIRRSSAGSGHHRARGCVLRLRHRRPCTFTGMIRDCPRGHREVATMALLTLTICSTSASDPRPWRKCWARSSS